MDILYEARNWILEAEVVACRGCYHRSSQSTISSLSLHYTGLQVCPAVSPTPGPTHLSWIRSSPDCQRHMANFELIVNL